MVLAGELEASDIMYSHGDDCFWECNGGLLFFRQSLAPAQFLPVGRHACLDTFFHLATAPDGLLQFLHVHLERSLRQPFWSTGSKTYCVAARVSGLVVLSAVTSHRDVLVVAPAAV